MRRVIVLVCAAAPLLCAATASARLLESWPYDKLFKEADVIVIAKALTAEEAAADSFVDDRWPLRLIGINTTFEVVHVIKGKAARNKVQVLHFKFGESIHKGKEVEAVFDGPSLVEFRGKELTVKTEKNGTLHLPAPQYMLFLRARKDGRYEPVSGRIDPVMSVRELFDPSHSESGFGGVRLPPRPPGGR